MFDGGMHVQLANGLALRVDDLPDGRYAALPCDLLQDVLDPEFPGPDPALEHQLARALDAHVAGGYRYGPAVRVVAVAERTPLVAVFLAAGPPLLVSPDQELLTRWGWKRPGEIRTGSEGVACRGPDGRALWTRVYEVRPVRAAAGYTLGYTDNLVVQGVTCRTPHQ